jgi:CDP-paratose 2-epimerase
VTDQVVLDRALVGVTAVYHFAAQVAVTTSLDQPVLDFDTNVSGTFRLLEAVRRRPEPPAVVFASTNKVYGDLAELPLAEKERRYAAAGRPAVDERQPLDFHTPYGCSKGAADQYVLDYARSYGLRATALRMSCIYGPRQCGTEDQGWVAHFLRSALRGEPVHVYGNGKQVRDILYVDDLVAAQHAALRHVERLTGRAWNVGGGLDNSVSLLEVLEMIADATGRDVDVRMAPERPGDQKYYVSDCSAFSRATGWSPTVAPRAGIDRLTRWFRTERGDGAEAAREPERVVAGR